jgi:hypothetical protein
VTDLVFDGSLMEDVLTVKEGIVYNECSTDEQQEASGSAKDVARTAAHTSSPLLLGGSECLLQLRPCLSRIPCHRRK